MAITDTINALKSLTELYEMPLLMIMSHRGTEGENICGQVPMGESTPKILEGMNFKFFKPGNPKLLLNLHMLLQDFQV